jgi:hypothetical protein
MSTTKERDMRWDPGIMARAVAFVFVIARSFPAIVPIWPVHFDHHQVELLSTPQKFIPKSLISEGCGGCFRVSFVDGKWCGNGDIAQGMSRLQNQMTPTGNINGNINLEIFVSCLDRSETD